MIKLHAHTHTHFYSFFLQFQPDADKLLSSNSECVKMTPSGSHNSELWEENLKVLNYYFKEVIGSGTYSYKEFSTITALIHVILNSRRLIKLMMIHFT